MAKKENKKIHVEENSLAEVSAMGFRLKNGDFFSLYKDAESKGLKGEQAHEYVHQLAKENGEWFNSNLDVS